MAAGIDWFRWHHGSVTDPKFQLVARRAGASLPDVIAIWAALLETASQSSPRGSIESFDPEAYDVLFNFPGARSADVLAALTERGLLKGMKLVAWEKRQPKREREFDDSTTRVKEHRRRKKESECVTPRNASNVQETPREEKSREEHKSERDKPAPSASDPLPANELKRATLAGDACLAMRKAGCVMTNPGHPELLAALSEGVTPEELGFAVVEARDRGIDHPFVYAIKAARTLHATKASPTPTSQARAGPRQQAATPGKTVQALQNLEAMKSGPDLDQERNLDRLSEAGHAQLGASAGG